MPCVGRVELGNGGPGGFDIVARYSGIGQLFSFAFLNSLLNWRLALPAVFGLFSKSQSLIHHIGYCYEQWVSMTTAKAGAIPEIGLCAHLDLAVQGKVNIGTRG